jgi:predicted Zn-dependent protease
MAKAGYDPEESLKLWQRMSAAQKGAAPPEFISTHPSDTTRQGNLSQWLPQAEAAYAASPQKYGIGAPIK